MSSRRSSASATRICRSLPRSVPVGPSSRRRATCIVRVEPPETTRPAASDWTRGAGERERVDAGVAAEAPVLEGDELVEIAAVDGVEGDRQAPAAVGDGVGGEQRAVPVEHDRRGLGRERRQHRRVDPAVEGQGSGGRERQRRREERRAAAGSWRRGTVTVPASVRAR